MYRTMGSEIAGTTQEQNLGVVTTIEASSQGVPTVKIAASATN